MSRTTITKNAAATEPRGDTDLARESIARKTEESSERQAFYREYREALREYLAGKPERFEAFQLDPRIRPLPETVRGDIKALATTESATIVTAERISLMTEAKVALISLMASMRSLSTALGSFF